MNTKEINVASLYKLQGYLEAVGDFIKAGVLRWEFEATLFEYESSDLDIVKLIKSAYPDSKPEKAEIVKSSVNDILKTFKHELGKSLPPMETERMLERIVGLNARMWNYLDECIGYRQAIFFEYFASSEPDSLSGGILGEFAFVICNEYIHRCLFIIGVTTD